ncbi:phospholipase D [Trifolium repens]|nr:phospholipase D [Trifolium repens]
MFIVFMQDYGIAFDDHDQPVKLFQCKCCSKFSRNMKRSNSRFNFSLMDNVYSLTFIPKIMVPRKELQLVGISSMLIASRYEELLAPENLVCEKNVMIDMSIYSAYVKAIKAAQKFIYIENQYFLGSSYNWDLYKDLGANNLIPMELR